MGYFDQRENVDKYTAMCEGEDGQQHINRIKDFLDKGSAVLELGMGPGKDFDLLSKHFKVTGSDQSQVFLDLYREKNPDADLLQLDAIQMNIERKFDGLYSNKVLQHLSKEELETSISNQLKTLNEGGVILHTLWQGSGEEFKYGMRFNYYSSEEVLALFSRDFSVIEVITYQELEPNDSIRVVAKVKPKAN